MVNSRFSEDNIIFNIPSTSLRINGSDDFFPVGRVFCIGTNYLKHSEEMGSSLSTEPTFFIKPHHSICQINNILLPGDSINIHHEVELVVCLKSGGKNIQIQDAKKSIYGYAVGLDLTKRDIQKNLKENKKPWELSKVFDNSAPISSIQKLENKLIKNKNISLKVNGSIKQDANIDEMIHGIDYLISYLSRCTTLYSGDLIFTGTPAGVSQIKSGDSLEAEVESIGNLTLNIN